MQSINDFPLDDFIKTISEQTNLKPKSVSNVLELFNQKCTIPFIARYRKHITFGLDEIQLREIEKNYNSIKKLYQRKLEIINILEKSGKLDKELYLKIINSESIQTLEDIYQPFKKNRKTKADTAIEKGLKPLSDFLKKAKIKNDKYLKSFLNEEKNLLNVSDVILNASYIIAEEISHNLDVKNFLRVFFRKKAFLVSEKVDDSIDEKSLYKSYYTFEQIICRIPPYRFLAIKRGESEGILKVSIKIPYCPDNSLLYLLNFHKSLAYFDVLEKSLVDSLQRLLLPSIRRDTLRYLKEYSDKRAIYIFKKNLKYMLLTPPLKKQRILGIDPGFKTGCKLALIDENNNLIDWSVIYPNKPQSDWKGSSFILDKIYERNLFNVIAIGNGTGSRETEEFINSWIKDRKVGYIIVSESGASVYSASENAIEEFPKLDITTRSAVSIARRVQNPLDELVKIPPESIGVGMYQHDISVNDLRSELDTEVETVVNSVGVDLNSASMFLLRYISGFNCTIAKSIVEHRLTNGSFSNRRDLLKVKGVGKKAYQQAAGFCRIAESSEILDNTIIHPETYSLVYKLFKLNNIEIINYRENKKTVCDILKKIDLTNSAKKMSVESFVLKDIVEKLCINFLDPREKYPQPMIKNEILDIDSIYENLVLEGTIKNIVDFGIFVDIGIKENGLVHKSKIKDSEELIDLFFPGQIIKVKILEIDKKRERISLEYVGLVF